MSWSETGAQNSDANFQEGLGDLPRLHFLSRLQRLASRDKTDALESGFKAVNPAIVPALLRFHPQTSRCVSQSRSGNATFPSPASGQGDLATLAEKVQPCPDLGSLIKLCSDGRPPRNIRATSLKFKPSRGQQKST